MLSDSYYAKGEKLLKQLGIQFSDKEIITIKDIVDSNNFSGVLNSNNK